MGDLLAIQLQKTGDAESFEFDLAVPGTHAFKDVIIEVGKANGKSGVVVKDATEKQKRLSRRSIRERGVLGTLNRMSVAFRSDPLALQTLELGVQKLQSLASGEPAPRVTFQLNEEPQNRLYSSAMKSNRSMESTNRRFIEWALGTQRHVDRTLETLETIWALESNDANIEVTMSSSITSMPSQMGKRPGT